MKSATNHGAGSVVDLLRRADLLDTALVHDGDTIRHRHRLELVVGDVDGGRIDAVVQLAQLTAHQPAKFRIQRAQRLIMRKALGRRTMARPRATRWRSPPESPPSRRSRR